MDITEHLTTIKCSAGKPSGPGLHVEATSHAPPTQKLLQTKYTLLWQQHSPMAGQYALPHCKLLKNGPRNERAQVVELASIFPRSQSNRASVGCTGTSLIHGGPNVDRIWL